ncbi:zinc-binding dehydrogenase [Actinomadura sp. LD22]|uniref:Zinc-binding dehydrogenase n=1 Tax=Actinomadura physcomitrii TaxID=2650748 RepID=A0A6I4M1V7_9ACTN|nr:zinc-binding dehydrogenase [Actinomadura physcomitrii]MVZ99937.1 zinc-binding dehydrogenase [Actinomadura physcomitrii]
MRTLMFTGPARNADRTEVVELPAPRPGPAEVAIEVVDAGINFLDVMARRDDPGYVPAWPYAPGKEVAGIVREVGDGVTGLRPGTKVAALTLAGGGLAEVAVAPAALTVPVPDGVPMPVAAAAPLMLASALLLLTQAGRFSPGESVLVHSASGGIGAAVAQLVPALGGGLRIGTVGRAGKVAEARKRGYDVALARDEDIAAEVMKTVDAGVDVVLDPLGTDMLDVDLAVAAPGARIVLFGNAAGGRPAPLPPMKRLLAGNVAIAGFSISGLSASAPARVAEAVRRVLDLVADGRLDVEVTEVGSLAEVAGVHQLLAEGHGTGKYVARLR